MTRLCCGSEKYIRVVECTFKTERMCGREENQKQEHLCVASFSYFCLPSQTRSTVLAVFAFWFF